jgi:SAM-dependent methyltransferase
MEVPVKVNIGCGATPTEGWVNFDNSLVARLARWPVLVSVLGAAKILPQPSREFARVATHQNIRFANASLRIPCASGSVEVAYSSHMMEHLDRREARAFLLEVRRVLQPGGIVRLAVPDLARLVNNYNRTGDADEFIARTHLGWVKPVRIFPRLVGAVIGPRHHLWMYDGRSLVSLLCDAGFKDVSIMLPGFTNIASPGRLDLMERAEESVYVEGENPL